jgi:hypothetical protein
MTLSGLRVLGNRVAVCFLFVVSSKRGPYATAVPRSKAQCRSRRGGPRHCGRKQVASATTWRARHVRLRRWGHFCPRVGRSRDRRDQDGCRSARLQRRARTLPHHRRRWHLSGCAARAVPCPRSHRRAYCGAAGGDPLACRSHPGMTAGDEPASARVTSARVRSSAPSRRAAGSAPSDSRSVCEVVQAYAERIGLRATDFGAHSLRAGFLTGPTRRLGVQDAGRVAAQEHGRAAGLCAGRRSGPGSRWGGAAMRGGAKEPGERPPAPRPKCPSGGFLIL